jgi:tetratricopeptide (TPR) repeat protein
VSKIYPPMTPKSSNSNIASRNGGDTSSSSHDGNSYKDLLFFAQAAYSRREYELALSQLTLALSIITREPLAEMLGVLDTRAAAYEKLGGAKNLKLALRDARKMMTTFPSSPKGYLRAAKVLQLMGLFDAALDIYDRGLRKLEGEKDGVRVS